MNHEGTGQDIVFEREIIIEETRDELEGLHTIAIKEEVRIEAVERVERITEEHHEGSTAKAARDETDLDDILFFSIFMALGSFVVYALLALVEALSYLWSPLSIACYTILLLISSFIMYVYLAESEYTREENEPFHLSTTLIAMTISIVSFSQISRHLALLIGGFSATRMEYWHWLRFGIAQLLDSSLFNMSSIYQWNVTEIQPTTFWTRTFVFIYNLSIEFFIVAVVLQRMQVARKRWARRKAERHVTYLAFVLARAKTWIFIAIWAGPFALFLGAVVHDGFSLQGAWATLLVSAPVMLGLWLTWYSMIALTLSGLRNRLLALAMIGAGIGILYVTMPHLLAFLATR